MKTFLRRVLLVVLYPVLFAESVWCGLQEFSRELKHEQRKWRREWRA